MNEPRRRGRPLDRDRDHLILKTALELLSELGFDRFRMQDVAERAGVGFGTIYRRWPTKGSLIVAALKSAVADVDEENTRDVEGLRRQFVDLANVIDTKEGDLIPGLIAAIHRDPDLAETFRTSWCDPRLAAIRATVRAAAPGPLDDDVTDLIAQVGLGVLLVRSLLLQEPVDTGFVNRIVDDLLAPLMGVHADQDRTPRRASVGTLNRAATKPRLEHPRPGR